MTLEVIENMYVQTPVGVWVFTGKDFVKLSSPCCCEDEVINSVYVSNSPVELGDVVTDETGIEHLVTKAPKRNKQVDVPTEQWQKSVDRKLEYANNTIVPLIAYLSAHHDFDISKFNEWKQEYLDAIKE